MKTDEASLIKIVRQVVEATLTSLESRLFAEVDRKVESYRRAVWVRDEWCCKAMVEFASHFWCAPRPKREGEYYTLLAIRGEPVNYCPFCGVFVGRTEKHEN